jgi:dTMP kinase
MSMKGKLITLEGIDGSGKSTITERLRSNPEFKDFVFTREPTTGWIGDAVNRAIHSDTDDLAEEHISKLILPALESGQNVISDRYSGSRYAYQAVTLKDKFPEPMEWIQQIHHGWTVDPDLTVLFDIDPEISVERCGNRGEQTKFEKIDFLEEVRANYLKLAEAHPKRFVIINTDRAVDEIEKDVLDAIHSLIEG